MGPFSCSRIGRPGPVGPEKSPAIDAGPSYTQTLVRLARGDVRRTRAPFALSDFEIDRLALIERGVTLGFDLRVVDEQVFAATSRANKAKSLTGIEPFYCTFCHEFFS